jgi:hypothetical protein
MGKDKFENEDLIKHGWPNDVWFHVDKLSSAHVYLRLPPQMSWESIPEALLIDIAQLTKANSIEGNKKDNIVVIYTPWNNLKKQGDMDTGQVSFHRNKTVKRIKLDTRINSIINRLMKTRIEEYPDFENLKILNLKMLRKQERFEKQKQEQEEMAYNEETKKQIKSGYGELFQEEFMYSNKGLDLSKSAAELEDDFM